MRDERKRGVEGINEKSLWIRISFKALPGRKKSSMWGKKETGENLWWKRPSKMIGTRLSGKLSIKDLSDPSKGSKREEEKGKEI